jgi:hypothetical protein
LSQLARLQLNVYRPAPLGIANIGLQSAATVHPPAGGNSERTEA